MRIRRAAASDVPAMRFVITRAFDPDQVRLGYLPPAAEVDLPAMVARRAAWVGEADSQVMAVLLAEPAEAYLMVRVAAVDPPWQGRGCGRELVEHAEGLAHDAGLAEVRVHANVLMQETISLYEHCGFRVRGQRPHPQRANHEIAELIKAV